MRGARSSVHAVPGRRSAHALDGRSGFPRRAWGGTWGEEWGEGWGGGEAGCGAGRLHHIQPSPGSCLTPEGAGLEGEEAISPASRDLATFGRY